MDIAFFSWMAHIPKLLNANMNDSEGDLPVIDFGHPKRDGDARMEGLAAQIDHAFRTHGYAYLQNFGIPPSDIEQCFAWSKRFFDLPREVKQLIPHPPGNAMDRGWADIGIEMVSKVGRQGVVLETREVVDVKESFDFGHGKDASQPNLWLPDDKLSGFRSFMEGFFTECDVLVHEILHVLSYALKLEDKGWMSRQHSQSLFQLRLAHYPQISKEAFEEGSETRCSSHSDLGTLTLLFQDEIGGLEVESPPLSGLFKLVVPVADTVIVHVGDLMEFWSNGRWRTTVHQVVAPLAASQPHETVSNMCATRYSMPYFAVVDPGVIIEPLPGTWNDTDNPKKFEPVNGVDYVLEHLAASYD